MRYVILNYKSMINLLMGIISALFGAGSSDQTSAMVGGSDVVKDQPANTNVTQTEFRPFFHS